MELTETEQRLLARIERVRWSGYKKREIMLAFAGIVLAFGLCGWGLWTVGSEWTSLGERTANLAGGEGPGTRPLILDYYQIAGGFVLLALLFLDIVAHAFRKLWALPFRRNDLQNHQHMILRLVERLRETGELAPGLDGSSDSPPRTPVTQIFAPSEV